MVYRHGSGVYQIQVVNPDGVENGIAKVEVDGKNVARKVIPLKDDGKTHTVLVTMGAQLGPNKMEEPSESAPETPSVPPASAVETIEAPQSQAMPDVKMSEGTASPPQSDSPDLSALEALQSKAAEGAEFDVHDVEPAPIVEAEPELPPTEVEGSTATPEQVTNFEPLHPVAGTAPKIETLEELKLETAEEADAKPMEEIATAGEEPTKVTKAATMVEAAAVEAAAVEAAAQNAEAQNAETQNAETQNAKRRSAKRRSAKRDLVRRRRNRRRSGGRNRSGRRKRRLLMMRPRKVNRSKMQAAQPNFG